jgi:hypothetical protein
VEQQRARHAHRDPVSSPAPVRGRMAALVAVPVLLPLLLTAPAAANGDCPAQASQRDTTLSKQAPAVSTRFESAHDQTPAGIWMTLDLRADATFPPGQAGYIELVASINGHDAAHITLEASKDTLRTTSVSFIGGRVVNTVSSRTSQIKFSNYLQDASLQVGSNELTVRTDKAEGAVPLIHIHQATVTCTTVDPEELSLALPVQVVGRVGEPIVVPYTLARRGGRPDLPVYVHPQALDPGLEVGPDARRHNGGVDAPGPERSFTVTAATAGTYSLAVQADGFYNRPADQVTIVVQSAPATSSAILPAMGTLAALTMPLLIHHRRRLGQTRTRSRRLPASGDCERSADRADP